MTQQLNEVLTKFRVELDYCPTAGGSSVEDIRTARKLVYNVLDDWEESLSTNREKPIMKDYSKFAIANYISTIRKYLGETHILSTKDIQKVLPVEKDGDIVKKYYNLAQKEEAARISSRTARLVQGNQSKETFESERAEALREKEWKLQKKSMTDKLIATYKKQYQVEKEKLEESFTKQLAEKGKELAEKVYELKRENETLKGLLLKERQTIPKSFMDDEEPSSRYRFEAEKVESEDEFLFDPRFTQSQGFGQRVSTTRTPKVRKYIRKNVDNVSRYEGEPELFDDWKISFDEHVHNTDASIGTKYLHLKEKLSLDVATLIARYTMDTYQKAYDTIVTYHTNPSTVQRTVLAKVGQMVPIESTYKLSEMKLRISTIWGYWRLLEKSPQSRSFASSTFCQLITTRFPDSVVDKPIETHGNDYTNVEQFLMDLETEIKKVEKITLARETVNTFSFEPATLYD